MFKYISSRHALNLTFQVCSIYLLAICNLCLGESTLAAAPQVAAQNNYLDLPLVRVTPEKSVRDTRDYRQLELPNHLQVLLVSDASLTRSALAVHLAIGGIQDPVFLHRLPRWPERLLDLPSENFAQGTFAQQVRAWGGQISSSAKANSNVFSVEVNSTQLTQVLAHFSEILQRPQVDAGFIKSLNQPKVNPATWRPTSPQSRELALFGDLFQVGESGGLDGGENTPALESPEILATRYLQRQISPERVKLVVVAPLGLDHLEKLVVNEFADWKPQVNETQINQTLARGSFALHKFANPVDLPLSIDVKPELEYRQLSFNFPVPIKADTYTKKPYEYIARMVRQKGPGSLLSFLKRLGWAQNVSAGLVRLNDRQGLFQIHLALTRQGVKAKDQLVPLVFYVLDQIRTHGVAPWRYGEMQTMADLEFQFADDSAPGRRAADLAFAMQNYGAPDLLRNRLLFAGYDEKLIKHCLARLQPDNLLVVLTAPEVQPLVLSKPSEIAYNLRHQLPPLLDLKFAAKQALSLPEHNTLIPIRMAVKSSSMLEEPGANQSLPQLIMESKTSRVWYAQDRQFKQPQAYLAFNIKSPLVAASVAGAAQAQVFAALINDQVAEYAYMAGAAGISYSFNSGSRGYELKLKGFSGRQSSLLNKVVSAIAQGNFTPERFAVVKEELLRKLRNRQQQPVPIQIANLVAQVERDPAWSDEQIIQALNAMDFASFSRFASNQLLDANMDMLVYGNYFRQEALKLAVLVEHELLDRQTGRGMTSEKFITLGATEASHSLPLENGAESGWVGLWIPARSADIREMTNMLVARHILAAQLASSSPYVIAPDLTGFNGISDSPLASSLLLVPRNDTVAAMAELDGQLQAGAALDVQARQAAVAWLKAFIALPPIGWQQKAEFYWAMICNYQGNFLLQEQLLNALKNFSDENFDAFYKQVFLSSSHRLWLNVAPESVDGEKPVPIENLEDFKRTQPGFFLP